MGEGNLKSEADFNMTDPTQQCPRQFRLITSPKRVCGKVTDGFGCDATYYETHNIRYNKVAGRATGYQQKSAGEFIPSSCPNCNDLINPYVDGIIVSLMAGYPRHHISAFAGSTGIDRCPCSIDSAQKQPSFVGSGYYCETGDSKTDPMWSQ